MGNVWLHRYSVFVACCTLLLVIAGGLVTSNDAALSVPDWPLAWGRLIPPLEGGIVYEFGHRVAAATVAILGIILAFWLKAREPRAVVRRLGWIAVGTILAQAALGGVLVRFLAPKPVSIAHACLGQFFFGLMVAICVSQRAATPARMPVLPLIAAVGLFAQTILGAALRHHAAGLLPHIIGAGIATILVMWAGLQVLMANTEDAGLRRPAIALLALTFSQIFLGMAAWLSRMMTADAPQPMPAMVWLTVAHVAVGSLAFGASVWMALAGTVLPGTPLAGTPLLGTPGGMALA
jgi:cytochrome c oxidase assembly protein subunit 15